MTEPYILNRSFKFANTDMYEKFGIRLREMPSDVMIPGLRSRKKKIPSRSGEFDYGAKYYDEREVKLSCLIQPGFSYEDSAIREIAYILSKKGQLRLWNCPDKYYIGRLYEPVDILQELKITTEFDLTFVCDPFAYGHTIQENFDQRINLDRTSKSYKGTASTPIRLEITNAGTTTATGIQISMTIKSN